MANISSVEFLFLALSHKGLVCSDVLVLMDMVDSGALAHLMTLRLSGNQIGDDGMKAFSAAIASGALGGLKELYLNHNEIGSEGMIAFSSAIASGALAKLEFLQLDYNKIGDAGMSAFSDAIASGSRGDLGKLIIDNPSQALRDACSARNIEI